MPYILDLRVDVGVVTGIFAVPTFHTLVTLGMTPSLFIYFSSPHSFHFALGVSSLEAFFLLRQVNFLYSWGGHSIHLRLEGTDSFG